MGTREDWFITSVWYFDEPDTQDLNQRLLELIQAERQADNVGMTNRSSVLGWHSRDDLHRRLEFRPFVEIVERNLQEVIAFQHWNLAKATPVISSCWAVVNGKYGSNTVHNHPNSLLSGVYYLQASNNCGALSFRDPRSVAVMMAPPVTEMTAWTFRTVAYQPKPGRMLIFPSWLDHGVAPNLADEERVALSFNISLRAIES